MMIEQKNTQELFLTAHEVTKRYKISLRQLQRLVQRGEMPQPLKFGGCLRWSIHALEEFEFNKINEMTLIFNATSRHCAARKK